MMALHTLEKTSPRRQVEFEQLATRYQKDLYWAAMRMTHNREDAEDLAQEALIRAYRAFDRFEPDTNFRAWVLRILTNTGINQHRRTSKIPRLVSLDELPVETEPQMPSHYESTTVKPEESYLAKESRRYLLSTIESLPEKYASVIKLSDMEELTLREISERLGIPMGTVQSRLSRGRRLLRDRLNVEMV